MAQSELMSSDSIPRNLQRSPYSMSRSTGEEPRSLPYGGSQPSEIVIAPLVRRVSASPNTAGFVASPDASPRINCEWVALQEEYIQTRLARLTRPGVDEIPEEVASYQILLHCDVISIVALRRTCKLWYQKSLHQGLWEYFCFLHFEATVFGLISPTNFGGIDWMALFRDCFVSTKNLQLGRIHSTVLSTLPIKPENPPLKDVFLDSSRAVFAYESKFTTLFLNGELSSPVPLPSPLSAIVIHLPYYCLGTSHARGHPSLFLYNTKTTQMFSWGQEVEGTISKIIVQGALNRILTAAGRYLYIWDFSGSLQMKLDNVDPIKDIGILDQHSVLVTGGSSITLWNTRRQMSYWKIEIENATWLVLPEDQLVIASKKIDIYNHKNCLLMNTTEGLPAEVQSLHKWRTKIVCCLKSKEIQIWTLGKPDFLESTIKVPVEMKEAILVHQFLFFSDGFSLYQVNLKKPETPAQLVHQPGKHIISFNVTLCGGVSLDESGTVTAFGFTEY